MVVIIGVFARPVHKDEPIKRDHFLSIKKLCIEGSLEEVKTILGWELDFCILKATLTHDKFEEWSVDIS